MNLNDLTEEVLCDQFCARIRIHRRNDGVVFLDTPFTYPDGDRYPMVLTESPTGAVRITENGHTLMHLSYENEVDKFLSGSRGVLFEQILREENIKYDEDNGQFYIDAPMAELAHAAFQLGQGLGRIYDLTFLNRSRVASTFYDDLHEMVQSIVSEENVQRDYQVPGIPHADHYPVDFRIEGKDGTSIFLMGIPSRDKARLATIFLQYFIQHEVDFESLLVFEEQQEIPRADLARLSNVGGEMIASLNAEDDFRRKLMRRAA